MIRNYPRILRHRIKLMLGDNPLKYVDAGHARKFVPSVFPTGGTGVEIGVFKGQFSRIILDLARPSKLYLIDPWKNFDDPDLARSWYAKGSKNNMEEVFDEVRQRFAAEITQNRVEILRAKTVEVSDSFVDNSLDFAYIDGDHRYESVAYDLEFAFSKVRAGGIIATDDHLLGAWWSDGVVRAVNEFLGQYSGNLQIIFFSGSQMIIKKLQ